MTIYIIKSDLFISIYITSSMKTTAFKMLYLQHIYETAVT